MDKEPCYDNTLDAICSILEHSIEKNGDKPITLKHLLAILKMADNNLYQDEDDDGRYPID